MKRILVTSACCFVGWIIVGTLQIALLGERNSFTADMTTLIPMVLAFAVADAINGEPR